MDLDDFVKNYIKTNRGQNALTDAERRWPAVWAEFSQYQSKRVRDLPEREVFLLALKLAKGAESFVGHMYLDSEGLVTVGVGTLIDSPCKRRMDWLPLKVDGRPATPAERKADWNAVKRAGQKKVEDYAALTKCRISEDDAEATAEKIMRGLLDDFFADSAKITNVHETRYEDYPLLAWLAMLDMLQNFGVGTYQTYPSFNKAVVAGDWATAAKESGARNVAGLAIAQRYCLIKACDGFTHDPDAPVDVDDDDGVDIDIVDNAITVERVLDVPTLTQANPRNSSSSVWCGRASVAMVYNYYKAVAGKHDEYVTNSPAHKNLVDHQGNPTPPGYSYGPTLNRAKPGWGTQRELFPIAGRELPLDEDGVRAVVQPIIDSIDNNNPVVAYTGISGNVSKPRHLIVFSGYREKDGELWLHIDDPATMRTVGKTPKIPIMGPENLEILEGGDWQTIGARYWLKAKRLFEPNQHSSKATDLFCDHLTRPGFACWINPNPTPDSDRVKVKRTSRMAMPVDLGLGLGVSDSNLAGYYKHTEQDYASGYFPMGANSVWHGGVHVRGKAGTAVHAIASGEIVAARLGPDEDTGSAHYGSKNFILIRHQTSGKALNGLTGKRQRVGFKVTQRWNIRGRAALDAPSLGMLTPGDELEIVDPQSVRVSNYDWYNVKVTRSSRSALLGQVGFVGYRAKAFTDRFARVGGTFDDSEQLTWFSLYMHLAPEAHEADNESLKDIPWLLKTVRTETTRDPSDATISRSVGAGGVNRWADVRTVQTLLNENGNDCGTVDGRVGPKTIGAIRAFQGGFLSKPDGRVDVGGTTWRNLIGAAGKGEAEEALAVDTDLLAKFGAGGIQAVGRRVNGGQKLWTMGQHGSPGHRSHMVHLEVFSEKNLFPDWTSIEDNDNDFNMDSNGIAGLVQQNGGFWDSDDILTADEVKDFYRTDHDAEKVRYFACKFCTEWGVDLSKAIGQLKNRYFTYGLYERMEPYNFYSALDGVVDDLPPRHHWHYNPVALIEKLSPLSGVGEGGEPEVPDVNRDNVNPTDGNVPDPEDPLGSAIYLIKNAGRAVPFFFQGDSPWGARTSGINQRIADKGSMVSALAMVLSYYGRQGVDPGTLDAWLDGWDGYDRDGVDLTVALAFEMSDATPQLLDGDPITKHTDFDRVLKQRIAANRPTLALVDYSTDWDDEFDHVVVIVGRDEHGRYIMNDPGHAHGDGVSHPELGNILGFNDCDRFGGYQIVKLIPIDPVDETLPDDPYDGDLPPDPDPPADDGIKYGGYVLRRDDKDAVKKWGGKTRAVQGDFVAELQRDLASLGYWISNPSDETHRGMNADGHFGGRTRSAILLFQQEWGLSRTGIADTATADAIKAKVSEGASRPGHSPRNVPGAEFFQLPPSKNFGRYGDIMADNGDIWGTKAMIDCITAAADEWMKLGNAVFQVGDISQKEGGKMPGHNGHRTGTGVDIKNYRGIADISRTGYSMEETLKLANILMDNGAKRILFNCAYVIDKCDDVHAYASHHHHFHVDVVPIATRKRSHQECNGCHPTVYKNCTYSKKRTR